MSDISPRHAGELQRVSDFHAVLLGMAAHDLRAGCKGWRCKATLIAMAAAWQRMAESPPTGREHSRRHVFTALALRRPFVCCLAHSEDGDDLSELTVRLQIAVSFDDLVEGKGAIDNGLQLSFVEASANVSDRRL